MRMNWLKGFFAGLTVAALILPAVASAASAKGEGRGKDKEEWSSEKGKEFREKMLEKMQEKLGLDSQAAAAIGEIQSTQHEKMKSVTTELKAIYEELEDAVKDDETTDAEVQALMDRATAKKDELSALHAETQKLISDKIGPKKAAQLMLMKQKMMNKMKEMAKGGGKGKGKKGSWRNESEEY